MACGCQRLEGMGTGSRSSPPEAVRPSVPAEADERVAAERALACAVCPHAVQDNKGRRMYCGRQGNRSIALLTVSAKATCPVRRWPNEKGETRWLGMRWLGVPEPLRWVFLWRNKRNPKADGWSCGCLAWLRLSRCGALLYGVLFRTKRLRMTACRVWGQPKPQKMSVL